MPKAELKNGFTLIELLLYIGIASMVIFGFVGFFQMILEARVKNQTISEVNQEGSRIVNLLSQKIRNATAINTPPAKESSAEVSFGVPDAAKSPTALSLSGTKLRLREGAGGPENDLNSAKVEVSDLVVENLSRPNTPGIVRIRFTLSHANPANRNEYSFSQTFNFSASLRKK